MHTSLYFVPLSVKRALPMITRMDHFTLVSDNLNATRQFYVEVLGLAEGPRPPFPVPGFWLYAGEHPVLHVVGVTQMPEPRRGVLDHLAFRAEGLARTWLILERYGIRFSVVRAPGAERTWQLFMQDPNGAEVELDFDATELPPADWKTRLER